MVPIIVVGTPAIVPPSIVASTIIASAVVASTVVPATVVTVVISSAPIRSVSIKIPVSVIRRTVVGTGAIIARPIKKRDRNREPEDKSNPGARRRFSEERKSRDNQQEDNELLHNWLLDELLTDLIKRNDLNAGRFSSPRLGAHNSGTVTAYCKRRNAAPSAAMTNRRAKASAMVPLIARTGAGRVAIVDRFDSDSSAFRIAPF
jgi:hypothetical protein